MGLVCSRGGETADISYRMIWQVIGDVWLVLVALGALVVVVCLRLLAMERERQIETHDVAREANRIRREFQLERERDYEEVGAG